MEELKSQCERAEDDEIARIDTNVKTMKKLEREERGDRLFASSESKAMMRRERERERERERGKTSCFVEQFCEGGIECVFFRIVSRVFGYFFIFIFYLYTACVTTTFGGNGGPHAITTCLGVVSESDH